MPQNPHRPIILLVAICSLALSGCLAGGPGKPTNYYVLNSLYSSGMETRAVAELKNIAIAVGPIRLPQYLDRPQMVTRAQPNEIKIAEFSQWSEPLRVNFARVLAENLTILLDSEQIIIFPFLKEAFFDYQITVEVTRFDGNLEEGAQMRASWTIWGPKRGEVLLKKYSFFNEPVSSADMDALVAAESRTVADLSKEIAEAIIGLVRDRPAD